MTCSQTQHDAVRIKEKVLNCQAIKLLIPPTLLLLKESGINSGGIQCTCMCSCLMCLNPSLDYWVVVLGETLNYSRSASLHPGVHSTVNGYSL